MAATASFKQQCPSCEAMVPIRDPNLIGRKIDCPKCKYRFVVEDPGTTEDEDEPKATRDEAGKKGAKGKSAARRRDEDDEDDGKGAKSGGNNKLILGVGLAVVAVLLLGVVGYFVFMSGGESKTAKSSGSTTPSASSQAAEAPKEEEKKEVAASGSNLSVDALTNLMPPETEGVSLVHMQDLKKTPLGRVMLGDGGAFNNAGLQQRLGFGVDDIDVIVQGWNFRQNWTLTVVHTRAPVNVEAVKAALHAKPADDKPDGQEYFILGNNPWLDMLGHTAFAMLLQTNPMLLPQRTGQRALRVFDEQTLVFADAKPMQLFLSKKGAFDKQAPDAATSAAAEKPKDPEEGASGGAGNMRNMMGRGAGGQGGGPPPGMGGGMMGGMGRGGQEQKPEETPAGPSGSYLTIKPALKTMLDRVEAKQPVISLALDTNAANEGHVPVRGINLLNMKTLFEEGDIIGAAVQFKDGITLTVGVSYEKEENHDKHLKSMQTTDGPELAKQLTKAMETEVEYTEEDPNALAGGGTGQGMGGMGMGMMGRGQGQGMGGGMPSMSATKPQMGSGGGGGGGGPPPGMTMPPPRGGRQGGGEDMGMGMGMGMGTGGGRMGMGMMGQQQTEKKSDKPTSTVRVSSTDKSLILITMHFIDQTANNKFVNRKLRTDITLAKGLTDMAGSTLRIHELANAVVSYPKNTSHLDVFPRGTVYRKPSDKRDGRPYPPNECLSWMVELLPYLGPEQQALYGQIYQEESWRHPDNLPFAATLIPQFLDPQTPQASWYVRVPGTDQAAATTQFVGIAGVGLDAATYSDSDPAVANKLGIFGYDRQTKLSDITDKTSNTIFLIEAPPTYKRPWMAGGGSTVMGVPETGSIRPFVSTQRDGKRGTYALMADGSVRWISENISDEVFKALCTVKGGETVLVNREAPIVPPEGQQELKVITPPPIPVTKPKAAAPPPPAEEKKSDGGNDKVVAILNQKCARCHTGQRAQGKPPYQLFASPGVLNANAAMDRLLEVLESGKMPPQRPGMNNPRLTDEETTILQKWAQSKR